MSGFRKVRNAVIALVRRDYHDFGPTLIAEKIDESATFGCRARLSASGCASPVFGSIAGNVANVCINLATVATVSAS